MGGHDVAARRSGESEEPGAVIEAIDELLGDCQGHACLAAPRRPGDRDQPGPFEGLARYDDVVVAADQSGEHDGEVVPGTLWSDTRRRVEVRILDQHRLLE